MSASASLSGSAYHGLSLRPLLLLVSLLCLVDVWLCSGQATTLSFPPSVGRLFIQSNQPFSLATDAAGDLFVTASGTDIVVRLSPSLQMLPPLNSSSLPGLQYPYAVAVIGSSLFVADYLTALLYRVNISSGALLSTVDLSLAGISSPADVVAAVDGLSLYVLDANPVQAVHQVFLNGSLIRDVNTSQYVTNADGEILDLAVDAAGHIYLATFVAEAETYGAYTYEVPSTTAPGVLFVLNASGSLLRQFPIPIGAYSAPYPQGVAVLPDGSAVFVVDYYNSALLKLSANGILLWNVTTQINGSFSIPQRAAVDPTGTSVYVSDYANSRVDRFSAATGAVLSTFLVSAAAVFAPEGLAFNSLTNQLLVTDIGTGTVAKVAVNGSQTGQLRFGHPAMGGIGGAVDEPSCIGVDAAGFIYVYDGEQAVLDKFSPSGAIVQTFSTSNPALISYAGWALVVTANGDVWSPDQVNNRIVHWAANGTLLNTYNQTWAGSSTFQPLALAQLPNTNLAVTDRGGYVWIFTTAGQIVTRFNLSQTVRFSPRGLAVGVASNGQPLIFVSDPAGPAIRVFSITGQLVRSLNQSSPALQFPLGMALSPAGDLYVSDDLYVVLVWPNVLQVVSGVQGDPQFVGLRGQSFQVHGIDGAVYALLSSPSTQLNARFTFLDSGVCPPSFIIHTQCWSHPGSYLGAVSVQERVVGVESVDGVAGVQQLLVEAGPSALGFTAVQLNGRRLQVGERVQLSDTFWVHVESSHRLSVRVQHFVVELDNSDGFINQRLSPVIPLQQLADHRVHGLLGQTHSTPPLHTQGAISHLEGEVDDYTVSHLMASDCFFDRFGSSAARA